MHRDIIIRQLRAYQAKWVNESDVAEQFIGFISGHATCFERSLKIGHVTGSAWVTDPAGTHVLLTHHRKLNKWFQLGGHADGEPDIFKVAKREVMEESGLTRVVPVGDGIFDIDRHRIPARGDEPEHDHYDIRFAMQVVGRDEFTVSAESHELRWVEIDRLDEFTGDESMFRMAVKWKVGTSVPLVRGCEKPIEPPSAPASRRGPPNHR
jgi:8-oxo-dGTP pyrophosphatase MutT (NUDIX family)